MLLFQCESLQLSGPPGHPGYNGTQGPAGPFGLSGVQGPRGPSGFNGIRAHLDSGLVPVFLRLYPALVWQQTQSPNKKLQRRNQM